MLRYFYVIFLLISFKCIICYDYYEVKSNHRYLRRRDTGRDNNIENINVKSKSPGDKREGTQFDVVRFIQNNAEETVEDDDPFVYRNNLNENKEYSSLLNDEIDDSFKVQNKRSNYLSFEPDVAELADTPTKSTEQSELLDSLSFANGDKKENMKKKKYHDIVPLNLIRNPERKCSFRNMKFPFFSRNTTEKSKKQKRRKITSFFKKKVEKERSEPIGHYETETKKKRSYEGKLSFCPVCLRKFKKKSYNDKATQNRLNEITLRNSKQLYAALDKRAQDKVRNIAMNNQDLIKNDRKKREESHENERRLKELSDILNKLDSNNLPNIDKQN